MAVPDDETVHKGYLPFSENNLIRQAFRFYMDLYGWGGLEGGVDCSLLTADVYRSLGLDIPGDANRQRDFVPAKVSFAEGMSRKERLQALGQLRPGDMLFSPGHAMMYLGTDDRGEPYIIQAGSSRCFPGEGDEGALKYYTRRVTVDDFYFYKRPDKQLIDAIVSASGFLSHSENTFF
ncbi:NlpC/P60 family protein [Selenomonas sp. AB3002]|uniref:NlpC/P60 family protein n=1 Tax=Selenomonas sp. AB3002 TaxID=1392502 RepID=UPI000A415DC2